MLPNVEHVPSQTAPAIAGHVGTRQVAVTLDFRAKDLVDFTRSNPAYPGARGHAFRRLDPRVMVPVLCYAYLYPGYVSTTDSVNVQTIELTGDSYKATVLFNGVPKGNNEFAVFDFFVTGPTGSNVFVGSLAALVNNSGGKTLKVTVTPQTTLTFQAATALIGSGILDVQDLSQASLATQIANSLHGLAVDKTTGLFDDSVLIAYLNGQRKAWGRSLSISAPGADEVAVTNDVGNVQEANLAYNSKNFLGTGGLLARPAGSPCVAKPPQHLPGFNPPVQPIACAYIVGTTNGKLTVPVYGDTIVVSASNGVAPYKATTKNIPQLLAGSTTSITLPAMTSTDVVLKASDAFDWAFKTQPQLSIRSANAPPYQTAINLYPNWNYGPSAPSEFEVPGNFSNSNPDIHVNGWNPFGIPATDLQICDPTGACSAAKTTKTFAINMPFADPGTALTYFAWRGNSGTSIVAVPGCTGYTITPKNGSASITTTKPTFLTIEQQLSVQFARGKTCGSPFPRNSTLLVTAIGTDGTPYSGRGAVTANSYPNANVTMNTYLPVTAIKSITVQLTSAGSPPATVNLTTIKSAFTP